MQDTAQAPGIHVAVDYRGGMSKLEAQRAMRAARYDAAHAAPSTRTKAADGAAPVTRPARSRAAAASTPAATTGPTDAPAASASASVELCGHRSSIGGKVCKRPAGHTETTHRYT